jgi:hypothetical protein
VEARSQVPGLGTPGRRKPGKDRPPDERETAIPRGTDPPDAETPEAAARAAVDHALARGSVAREETARREATVERRERLREGENLRRRKPKGVTGTKQGRRGCGWSESVEDVRNVEDAAQSGQVSPVLVATRFCKRRRADNLMGGPSIMAASSRSSLRGETEHVDKRVQFSLNVTRRPGEDEGVR